MEGDDELLAEVEVKVAPEREEWMTTLPPERKVSPCSSALFVRLACLAHAYITTIFFPFYLHLSGRILLILCYYLKI